MAEARTRGPRRRRAVGAKTSGPKGASHSLHRLAHPDVNPATKRLCATTAAGRPSPCVVLRPSHGTRCARASLACLPRWSPGWRTPSRGNWTTGRACRSPVPASTAGPTWSSSTSSAAPRGTLVAADRRGSVRGGRPHDAVQRRQAPVDRGTDMAASAGREGPVRVGCRG